MSREKVIDLPLSVEMGEAVGNAVKTVGVRGLDAAKAKELGVFNRVSMLLCAAHASIVAAYRIYGGAQYLMDELGARKNEIARAMNKYEEAFDRFMSFWKSYQTESGMRDMNHDTEVLYKQIMRWMQIPEQWSLGDEQRTNDDVDTAIRVTLDDDRVFTFYKSIADEEILKCEESWCVTRFSSKTHEQSLVEQDMDKASALMVAKRMSSADSDIYTASLVQKVKKNETVVIPFRAFMGNSTIGKIDKTFR